MYIGQPKLIGPIYAEDANGNPLAGLSFTGGTNFFTMVSSSSSSGSWGTPAGTLVEPGGSGNGKGYYWYQPTSGDCAARGSIAILLNGLCEVGTWKEDIEAAPYLYEGLVSSVVSSTVLQLTSPVLTSGFYAQASSSRVAITRIVGGTGQGQMRLITDYSVVSGNGQATLDSAFLAVDTTSVIRIEPCVDTPELSTDPRLAQLVGLIASIAAIPTNPLLTTDARLNNLDAKLSSIIAAADVLPVTTPQPQSWGIVSGDYGAEYPMPITVVGYGGVVNLTTATSYQLRWLRPDGTVAMVSLTAVGLAAGQLERIWLSGDTSQLGVHRGQVVVTWPDSTTTTYPQDGSYYTWNVFPQLAAGAL